MYLTFLCLALTTAIPMANLQSLAEPSVQATGMTAVENASGRMMTTWRVASPGGVSRVEWTCGPLQLKRMKANAMVAIDGVQVRGAIRTRVLKGSDKTKLASGGNAKVVLLIEGAGVAEVRLAVEGVDGSTPSGAYDTTLEARAHRVR